MAQLSDDCFAFGGALLPVAEMERLIAERDRAGRPRSRRVPLAAARGRVIARDVVGADRPAAVRQFGGRRLCRAPRRPRGRRATPGSRSSTASPPAAPRRARSAPARRSASSPARRCRRAPTPCSCRRTPASKGGAVIVPPGLKRGANSRAAGEDLRAKTGHAAGRPAAHRHACRARRRRRAHGAAGAPPRAGRGVLDRRRDRRARPAAAAGRAVRRQPLSCSPA